MRDALAPILKTAIFTVVVPGSVAVLMPYLLVRPDRVMLSGALSVLGGVVVLCGAAVYLRCAWDFARHGRGTPLPLDAPKVLVSRGLHRYVRNPMYLGVLTVVFGEAALLHAPVLLIYGAAVWLLFHYFVVVYEEPALERQFGAAYDEYRRTVPRWMPRLRQRARR